MSPMVQQEQAQAEEAPTPKKKKKKKLTPAERKEKMKALHRKVRWPAAAACSSCGRGFAVAAHTVGAALAAALLPLMLLLQLLTLHPFTAVCERWFLGRSSRGGQARRGGRGLAHLLARETDGGRAGRGDTGSISRGGGWGWRGGGAAQPNAGGDARW